MSSESPFLIFKVECPVCKTINEFEQIKVGAYTEGGRDTDFCPLAIEWRYPKYQAYNPLVFFTATCSNCYYTRELSNKYREWKSDNAFRTFQIKNIKARHLEQLSVADSVVRQLGEAIDIHRLPNESAILKMHLAIFDAQLTDHPSNLDLGRFYLRIGWVFRNLNECEDPNLALLSGSFRDRYDGEIAALGEPIGSMDRKQQGFKTLLDEYRSTLLGRASGEGRSAFGEHGSLTDFLLKLQQGWNGIVVGEHQALEQAIRYYKEAFGNGRDIAAGNQQIQASYLIAELSRRIGDYDGAKQFFTSTIKAGQEFIYQNRRDQSRTVLARKILELAIEQGRANLKASKARQPSGG